MIARKAQKYLFIGSQSRLIRCVEIILEKGQEVAGIVTADTVVTTWAEKQGIRWIPLEEDWKCQIKQAPFDYLISVDNPLILPKNVLRLPRQLPINFHDAPLPKYAGTNATSWAIANGEAVHGITWHVMDEVIDAGDILKQVIIQVGPSETALTLNALCFEKSIEAFAELVDELIDNKEQRRPQDLGDRNYFPSWKRPPTAACIDWNTSAVEIDRLARSLDFGPYRNPLALPKLYLNQNTAVVRQVEIQDPIVEERSGTILTVAENVMRIASSTHIMQLKDFYTPDGRQLNVPDMLADSGFGTGDILPQVRSDQAEAITEMHQKLAQHETYWVSRLALLEPLTLDYQLPAVEEIKSDAFLSTSFSVPSCFLDMHESAGSRGDMVLAALAVYFARMARTFRYDLDYTDTTLREMITGMGNLFSMHVPLHIELDPAASWDEACQAVQGQLVELRARTTYCSDLILRYPELHERADNDLQIAVCRYEGELIEPNLTTANHDLLILIPDDGRQLHWLFRQNAFSHIVIAGMMDHLEVLLQSIQSMPQNPITHLAFLPAAEKEQLLVEFAEIPPDPAQLPFMYQIFEAEAARQPQKIAALVADDDLLNPFALGTLPSEPYLTYHQLNAQANQLARVLRRLAVGPEVIVGICLERSLEALTAILAIHKAGGAFLFLDPNLPQERISFMIADADVHCVITLSKWRSKLQAYDRPLICLDADKNSLQEEEVSNLDCLPSPIDLAYIVYTSGSTGMPKGVLIEHAGINVRMAWIRKTGLMKEHDRLIQAYPLSFDAAYGIIFSGLVVGLTLVIVPPGLEQSPAAIATIMQKYHLTFVAMVPSFLDNLLDQPEIENCPDLRILLVGGEKLSVELRDRTLQSFDCKMLNFYGPSETTFSNIGNECRLGIPKNFEPIGRPLAYAQVLVLDDHHQLLPVGVPGEIYIGGYCVGRGYINRPKLTSERFCKNPYSDRPGDRLYKTGDLGRIWPDGTLEFLGREDDQVKIRGYRIELGEIEARIREWDGVKAGVVIIREDIPSQKRLVGYIVPQPEKTIDTKGLHRYLEEKLPAYMIPALFVILERLPQGSHGKLDRQALPVPDPTRPDLSTNYAAPEGAVEELLAELWQEFLGFDQIGANDNFLELGGNSLMATQIINRLQNEFDIKLRFRDFFEYPTIASLTLLIIDR